MKRRIRLSPSARSDLEVIYIYIAGRNLRAADHWLKEIEQFFSLLLERPQLGMAYEHVRKRMRRNVKNGYRILYRIDKNEIVIVRILHPGRDIELSDLG